MVYYRTLDKLCAKEQESVRYTNRNVASYHTAQRYCTQSLGAQSRLHEECAGVAILCETYYCEDACLKWKNKTPRKMTKNRKSSEICQVQEHYVLAG